MTKFNRVLSDPQLISLASIANPFLHADSEGDFYISETGQDVDFDDVMALLRKIEQATVKAFKAKLAEQADMFWDVNNPEWSRESISSILLEDLEFDSSDVGKRVEFTRAKSLPNITVLITSYDEEEDEITWEVIENE